MWERAHATFGKAFTKRILWQLEKGVRTGEGVEDAAFRFLACSFLLLAVLLAWERGEGSLAELEAK